MESVGCDIVWKYIGLNFKNNILISPNYILELIP